MLEATAPSHFQSHWAWQRPPSFLEQIRIDFGPPGLLGRFFMAADDAARRHGVHLAFGTFEDLLRVNLENRGSWRAIIPTFDPTFSRLEPCDAFCLLGYNELGEVVATQACRLFRWQTKSFFDAAADLSLYYEFPQRDRKPGEACEVTAQHARFMRGRIAFSGAGWYRPDYRGKVFSRILPRISRACAYTRWATDCTTSMIQDGVLAGGMASRAGFENIDWHVKVMNSPMGNIRFAFVWMDTGQMLDDLVEFTRSRADQTPSRELMC